MLFGTYLSEDAEEAIRESSLPEAHLITMAYCLIAVYTCAVLGIGASGPTSLRTLLLHLGLALAGLICILIGLAGGVGVGLYLGNDLNALSVQVLPFVLLGLGINDVFVVSYVYLRELRRRRFNRDPARDRQTAADLVAVVAIDAGATITFTSAGNVFVFLVAGAFVRMRLVATFCFLAASGLVGTWLATVIAYTAVMALHARATLAVTRRERSKNDEQPEDSDEPPAPGTNNFGGPATVGTVAGRRLVRDDVDVKRVDPVGGVDPLRRSDPCDDSCGYSTDTLGFSHLLPLPPKFVPGDVLGDQKNETYDELL